MDTGAYADNGPRVTRPAPTPRPAPTASRPCSVQGVLRLLQHAPVGVLPRVRRDAPAVDRRVPARRGRAPRRGRPARVAAGAACVVRASRCAPTAPASRWTRISSVTLRRPPAAVGWDEPDAPWVGRGVSVGLLAAGAHPVSRASVRLCSDGSADVYVGTTEMGQGPRTVMAQIAAEELGPLERPRPRPRRRHPLHARTTARPARAARPRSLDSP